MNFYECEVIKKLEKENNNVYFESYGYNIHKKTIYKDYISYSCLLSEKHKEKLKKIKNFKIVKESKKPFNGTIYTIYCDASVYNYGNDEKTNINLSALTTIIYKDNKEIFKTTNVYEQFLDNNTAEILALLVGLRYLNDNEDNVLLRNSKILVSSDSKNLQEYIIHSKIIKYVVRKCNSDTEFTYYSKVMRELLNELNFYIIYLDIYSGWVKGHSDLNVNKTRAAALNHICDKLCKEALRKKALELNIINKNTKKDIIKNEKNYKKNVKREYKKRND